MISRVASDRPSSELDQQLAELLAEAADKLRAGEPVDLSDYVRRYPDFAERLEQLLPAMRTLAELGHSQSSVPSSVAGRGQAFEEVRGVLGDFRILREIGRGGMGVVYEAEQVSLGRRMALKVLPFAGVLDERQLTRFRNEARAAASLKHPNIVGVHSVGCERGVHYYAMEFIEGRTLAEVIAELRQDAGRGSPDPAPQAGRGSPDPAPQAGRGSPDPAPQAGRGSPDPAEAADPQAGRGSPDLAQATDRRSPEGLGDLRSGSCRGPETATQPEPDPVSERPDHVGAEAGRDPQAGRGSPDPAQATDRRSPEGLGDLRSGSCRGPETATQPEPDPVSERPDHVAGHGSLRAPPATADTDRQVQAKVSTHKPTATRDFFRRVAEWGIQAAEGLEHAHQMGIVHRDIKPSNLLVDASGHLWITDFGLAQILAPSPVAGEGWGEGGCLTMTGDILGTLRYMSPEQAAGRSRVLDHRTDVYSLGVTLYELLTLRPPFSGDDRHEVLRQIGDDEPPTLRQLNREIPRDLETIVLKAMSKEPQVRYATALDMAEDLQRFLADEPIRAKRAGPLVRVKKWSKRHKTVAAVVVATLFAVAVFGTATAVQAYHRHVRLTVTATEGLADVRVAMAQKEFAQAQRRATEIQAELAAAPKLKAQFGPELEDLLHQAEARLRLQRFEKLADEGRFAANRSLGHSWTNEPRDEARRVCQEAVAVFHVLDSERWLQDLEGLPLERTDVTRIKQSLTEVLFLLAVLEGGPADASGKRRAIALLNQLETLAPNLHVLYEYRGRYRTSIGEQEAARGDRQRASTIPRSTWLDHYFAAKEQTRFRDALRELEAALTIRVEDYWSWYFWSYFEYRLGEPDRARWGLSICIGLRPEEACAWFQRGFTQTGADRMADFNRVLELTSDPVLRVLSYCEISMVRQSMGQLEAALADAETAVRLQPDSRFASLRRAHCYQALGQADGARADARRVLDLCNDPGGGFRHFWPRIDALLLLGEPQAVVDECLAFLKTEQLQDYVPGWARGNEAKPGFGFMMAMARWKLGQKEDARRWYDKAVERIDKSKPEDETLRRFHEEAAATLGIPDKRPVERPKTDKAKGEMRHGDTETKTE